MEKIFEEKICSICKNKNTDKCKCKIKSEFKNDIFIMYCRSYYKDKSKIPPYNQFAYITAKRKSSFET